MKTIDVDDSANTLEPEGGYGEQLRDALEESREGEDAAEEEEEGGASLEQDELVNPKK